MSNLKKHLFGASSAALLCIVLLTGCASIVSKSEYPVMIRSTPAGASVTVRTASGYAVHRSTTPTIVTLKTSDGYFSGENYTVEFEKEGFSPASTQIRRGLDGWYIGNVLFGGLIGWLVVDPLTGAMWRLPDEVHGELQPLEASVDGEGLRLLAVGDLPEDLREHLVRIQ